MKRIILLFFIVMLAGGYGYSQEGYRITGNLGLLHQDTFYLVASGRNNATQVLGMSILKDGNIEFRGKVNGPTLAAIMTSDQQGVMPLMLDNANYTIRVGETHMIIEGGAEQAAFNRFEDLRRDITEQQKKMQSELEAAYIDGNQMRAQAISGQMRKYFESISKRQINILKEHGNTCAAAYAVLSSSAQAPPEELKAMYDMLGEKARASVYGRTIAAQLAEFERVAVGQIAPDFAVLSPEGERITLHGIKAKVKLVDFWASWCRPCRAANPEVVRLYKKYRDKGLEVLGVSFDHDKAAWIKAIQDDGLTWRNGSDLQGQASGILRLYSVTGIPHTLLLDENNRIVAKNLHGNDLKKKIDELLKSK